MHIVTKIEDYRKNRCKIYIDQEFAFVLYKGELRLHKIEEGEEISEELISELTEVVLPKRAKLRCMNLLTKKEYTKDQLVRKLNEGFYPEEIIEEAIAYVESFGYINDHFYAKRYIECKGKSRSKRRIKFDLINKGIAKDCLEEVFSEFDCETLRDCECEAIKKELHKRKFDIENNNYEERQKVISFLCKKGYNISFIKDVLDGNYLT